MLVCSGMDTSDDESQHELQSNHDELQSFRYSVSLPQYNNLKSKHDKLLKETKNERTQLEEKIQQLNTTIKDLQNENREWQNYIGNATTFSLNCNDTNHSTRLVKDIENLQKLLKQYVGNLKPKVDINIKEVNNLLLLYGCQTQVKSKDESLLLIKGVLQRYVLVGIIDEAKVYFEKREIKCSEPDIFNETEIFLNSLKEFSTTREGGNDITQAYPIKIRQHIYGLLGSLGFADIIDNEEKQEHPFIKNIKDKLNGSINNLRKINDSRKQKLHDDMAANLVREVIRIFYFRLKVQEPIAEYHMFSCNDKIDPKLMEGRWDEDEQSGEQTELNNLLVELCFFPLIVANYEKKDQLIYIRAKVVHIRKYHDANSNQNSDKFIKGSEGSNNSETSEQYFTNVAPSFESSLINENNGKDIKDIDNNENQSDKRENQTDGEVDNDDQNTNNQNDSENSVWTNIINIFDYSL